MAGQTIPSTADITAHSTALIAQDSDIEGIISFGPGCIVHPKATIHAISGEIKFGKDCVIEEGAKIVYSGGGTMTIGDGNWFMLGSLVQSPFIGNSNTFQARARTPPTIGISDRCTISAGTILEVDHLNESTGKEVDNLAPYTVVYRAGSEKRICEDANWEGEQNLRDRHIEYLREILPKFSRMRPV